MHFLYLIFENTFELIMQGKKEEYNQEICKFINKVIKDETRMLSVAQLSMVKASQQVEYQTARPIINPLNTLISSIVNLLEIEKKTQ